VADDGGNPPFPDRQFYRAIATNSLSALPQDVRSELFETHKLLAEFNRLLGITSQLPTEARSVAVFRASQTELVKKRSRLREILPATRTALKCALGETGVDEAVDGRLP
jgi:hypothetical protein